MAKKPTFELAEDQDEDLRVEVDEELLTAMRGREDSRGASEAEREGGRVPLGGFNQKLYWRDQDPNYVYRWINHDDARVADALRAGYEPVLQSEERFNPDDPKSDEWVTRRVGRKESNAPLIGVLMRIKKEWYEEDQAVKQQPVDDVERAIKTGATSDQSGSYSKDGTTYSTVNIQNGFRR